MTEIIHYIAAFIEWCQRNPFIVTLILTGVTMYVVVRYIVSLVSDRKYKATVFEVLSCVTLSHLLPYIYHLSR